MVQNEFSRTELLIGKDALSILSNSTVAVIGIGGVGSFTVEALARASVSRLILIDDDNICLTNINRQIHADFNSIGRAKVEVMKERVMAINKKAEVIIHKTFIREDNIDELIPKDVNYVVDAIDTVSSKLSLIMWCQSNSIPIISSMGTGNKLDPTKFKIGDIYKTKMCPLAKVMRYELRKRNVKSLKVLYSEEKPLKPKIDVVTCKEGCVCTGGSGMCSKKRQIPGSISFVPPVAGMIIAGEVIKDIINYKEE